MRLEVKNDSKNIIMIKMQGKYIKIDNPNNIKSILELDKLVRLHYKNSVYIETNEINAIHNEIDNLKKEIDNISKKSYNYYSVELGYIKLLKIDRLLIDFSCYYLRDKLRKSLIDFVEEKLGTTYLRIKDFENFTTHFDNNSDTVYLLLNNKYDINKYKGKDLDLKKDKEFIDKKGNKIWIVSPLNILKDPASIKDIIKGKEDFFKIEKLEKLLNDAKNKKLLKKDITIDNIIEIISKKEENYEEDYFAKINKELKLRWYNNQEFYLSLENFLKDLIFDGNGYGLEYFLENIDKDFNKTLKQLEEKEEQSKEEVKKKKEQLMKLEKKEEQLKKEHREKINKLIKKNLSAILKNKEQLKKELEYIQEQIKKNQNCIEKFFDIVPLQTAHKLAVECGSHSSADEDLNYLFEGIEEKLFSDYPSKDKANAQVKEYLDEIKNFSRIFSSKEEQFEKVKKMLEYLYPYLEKRSILDDIAKANTINNENNYVFINTDFINLFLNAYPIYIYKTYRGGGRRSYSARDDKFYFSLINYNLLYYLEKFKNKDNELNQLYKKLLNGGEFYEDGEIIDAIDKALDTGFYVTSNILGCHGQFCQCTVGKTFGSNVDFKQEDYYDVLVNTYIIYNQKYKDFIMDFILDKIYKGNNLNIYKVKEEYRD